MFDIGQLLLSKAVELIEQRYPTGWGGAAAVRVTSGQILVSVAPDVKNDGLSLCMEVGAYLEAHIPMILQDAQSARQIMPRC